MDNTEVVFSNTVIDNEYGFEKEDLGFETVFVCYNARNGSL